MFLSQHEYNLYSFESLIVSANQLAMYTCILIAVFIYHDVIIQILPSISIRLGTHTGLNKPHIFNILYYMSCYLLGIVLIIIYIEFIEINKHKKKLQIYIQQLMAAHNIVDNGYLKIE